MLLSQQFLASVLQKLTAHFLFSRLQAFDRVWEGVKHLVKGTACEKYVNEYLYK